jgi:transcription antitermination protein NusB
MPTNLRHRLRTIALQTLYEYEFAANSGDNILQRNLIEKEVTSDEGEFACQLVEGVISNRQILDDTIRRFATAFPVDQLAVMDRNILRLAIYEISIAKNVPLKVAINEAVELAKEFGASATPKFINGVLGAVITDATQKTP